jgi:hypothetical protein
MHVDADSRETFCNPVGDPLTRLARILANHGLCFGRGTNEVMTQRAANEIRALLAEREFSGYTADTVGPEQLPLLTHK